MKILGTVKEIQELQNKCMTTECDDCILSRSGFCKVYSTMQFIDDLRYIDPYLETTIDI